jgi:hypothetical protein
MRRAAAVIGALLAIVALAAPLVRAQGQAVQAVDENGAPMFKVDPFWPKPLPNRWSMQQVTGIHVDHLNHIWFLNRGEGADADEIGGGDVPQRMACCVRGPEVVELDQDGSVLNAWGGPGYHPLWPTALQTVIADSKGFVWVGGNAPRDSILKFTRDGKFVWDFGHQPPPGAEKLPENNQETGYLLQKGRFQLDEVTNELYIIQQKRLLVYDASTGAFKRGWGGHGMSLSEISDEPLSRYTWNGQPPPD